MTLLAIDPGRSYKGEETIGWCVFRDDGSEYTRGTMSWDQLVQFLRLGRDRELWFTPHMYGGYEIDEVVCEDFVNDPKSARGGQRNGTSECIGGIELACFWAAIPFTRQEAAALGPAKHHAPEGSWKKLKHLRHEDAAFLHGYEYLVRKGVLQSAGLSDTL